MVEVSRTAFVGAGLAIWAVFWWWGCCNNDVIKVDDLLADVRAPDSLIQHSRHEFTQPEIIKVTDGVYAACGYALANSIMLEGPDGLVIVDTTESTVAAAAIKKDFRRISDKPIRAIIFTHSHPDHTSGSSVFLEDEPDDVQRWFHESASEASQNVIYVGQGLRERSLRQFGLYLTEESRINAGIGPRLMHDDNQVGWMIPNPTHVVKGRRADITVAGLKLTLLHIPGETDDQIAVWWEDKKVLLPGDDIYRTFPNLYAIRGTTARNVLTWTRSLRLMRDLGAEYLVPSHTKPVTGKDEIFSIFNIYGDAVQLVHDQTVRYINKGLHPDDIAALVKLPPNLAAHPFLQEFYGTVEWSVKAVYDYYLGWFNGRIDDLLPLTPKESARRWVQLAGGVERVLHEAREAVKSGDDRWALELTSALLDVDSTNQDAKKIRAQTIKSIASTWTTANGRNYILTTMLEDFNAITVEKQQKNVSSFIRAAPIDLLIRLMGLRLKAEEVEDVVSSAVFNFTDVDVIYTLTVRNCIMDVTSGEVPGWDVKLSMTSQVWRSLLSRESTSLSAYLGGSIGIEGGLINARKFLGFFDRDVN